MTGLIADTGDHRLIRQSTAAIAARYGHGYYAERARSGGHVAELWTDLAQSTGLVTLHLESLEHRCGQWMTRKRVHALR